MTISSQDRILKHLTIIFREIFDDDDIVLTLESTADDIEEWEGV